MQAPAALRRLQGNRENHANLSVVVCEQDQFVFSRMVRDLETDFDIMDIQHLGMGKEAQIHYSIRVPEEKLDTCLAGSGKKGLLPNGRKGGGRQCLTRNFGMSGCDISIS